MRLAAFLCLLWIVNAMAADAITIDLGKELSDTARCTLGININYLMDDDHGRERKRSTADALKDMRVRYLRYPGGDKSDSYLWSTPPFERPRPTLASTGPGQWPSLDRNLVHDDGKTYKIDPLDFDEFMKIARNLKAEPVLVVCHQPMYKKAGEGGTTTSRERLVETAREWVRYANIERKYGVRYWEIGDETWLKADKKEDADAKQYAADLIEFSGAMKAVDPTIKIGANGARRGEWWKTVLETASGSIDFLAVHDYPCWEWKNYETYRGKHHDMTVEARAAIEAIDKFAPAADRARLTVAMTEVNAADWSKDGWPQVNDAGHGLVLCDELGQLMSLPRVEFSQVWNTRWIENAKSPKPQLWDALDKNGAFNPTGHVIQVWGGALLEKMVAAESSSASLRVFACYSAEKKKLNVIVINKDTEYHESELAVTGSPRLTGTVDVLSAAKPEDFAFTSATQAHLRSVFNTLRWSFKPLSITVVSLKIEK